MDNVYEKIGTHDRTMAGNRKGWRKCIDCQAEHYRHVLESTICGGFGRNGKPSLSQANPSESKPEARLFVE